MYKKTYQRFRPDSATPVPAMSHQPFLRQLLRFQIQYTNQLRNYIPTKTKVTQKYHHSDFIWPKLNKTSCAVVVGHRYIQAYHSKILMKGSPLGLLCARVGKVASKAEKIGHGYLRKRLLHSGICGMLSGPVTPHRWESTGKRDNPWHVIRLVSWMWVTII